MPGCCWHWRSCWIFYIAKLKFKQLWVSIQFFFQTLSISSVFSWKKCSICHEKNSTPSRSDSATETENSKFRGKWLLSAICNIESNNPQPTATRIKWNKKTTQWTWKYEIEILSFSMNLHTFFWTFSMRIQWFLVRHAFSPNRFLSKKHYTKWKWAEKSCKYWFSASVQRHIWPKFRHTKTLLLLTNHGRSLCRYLGIEGSIKPKTLSTAWNTNCSNISHHSTRTTIHIDNEYFR